MAASNPLINSPHPSFGRHSDMPYSARPKRSDSAHVEPPVPRGLFDTGTARMHEINEELTFIPTSLGEHLLERTYLDDVVRPLVRALVKARMTYGMNGQGVAESSQAYADLDKLRRELERSAQRARHAEQERDDLARRLDLAGLPDAARDRAERHSDHMGPNDHVLASSRSQQPSLTGPTLGGIKRPRPSDTESLRANYDHHPSAPGSNAVSVNVAHGDGPGASITVTTEAPPSAPMSMVSRPLPVHHGGLPGTEHNSPPMSYSTHPPAPRHRPYPYPSDIHHDVHDPEPRHLTPRMPLREPEYGYSFDDRHGLSRPPLSRFAGRSPPSSSAYLTPSSERSSMPTLTTYPSTSSSSSFSATPYSSVHPYDHDMDDFERTRKMPRGPMDHHASLSRPPISGPNSYIMTPNSASDNNYPVRKLASTKNRTCSNCAAPHDAKFRRGPNGPGTLCDRCGSRWKKFREQESANKREQQENHSGERGVGNSASAIAGAAAHARLSSASASSQSPMETAGVGHSAGNGGASEAPLAPESEERYGRASAMISPLGGMAAAEDGAQAQDKAQRDRERSASVDQLIDD
ncbi:uncharacterized protein MEPE_05374 [Melanopsichium pennsylvanicum]|uniref:GATA-type domain-containing protein n=2 Tax=Melanopsichium pennsylvanicum TaxID=63383 RepID=A0AAJ4XQI8_9BASI|nr:gata transcription factor [Melanopsichium pennsylvanicum 4]SNX86665.1 uncharacterized protein MEPE_05374 [Melanopsichium pennsylvanicum]